VRTFICDFCLVVFVMRMRLHYFHLWKINTADDGLVTEIATNISLLSTLSLSYFSLIVVTISRTGRKLDFSYLAAATLVRGGSVAEWLTC